MPTQYPRFSCFCFHSCARKSSPTRFTVRLLYKPLCTALPHPTDWLIAGTNGSAGTASAKCLVLVPTSTSPWTRRDILCLRVCARLCKTGFCKYMATVNQSTEVDDSRVSREVEEGSTTSRFTPMNGNKSAASPPQNTSFRPDPSALPQPPRQQQQQPQEQQHSTRQAPSSEGKPNPLFVDTEQNRGAYHEDLSFRSPEHDSNRQGKRKRSKEAFRVSPEFTSPPPRRDDTLKPPTGSKSPARSLPPVLEFREIEPQHAS